MNQKLPRKNRGIIFVGALLLATSLTGYIAVGSDVKENTGINFGLTQVQAATNKTSPPPTQTSTADDYYDDYYDEGTPTPTADDYYDDYYDEGTPTPTADDYYDDYYDEGTPTPTADDYYEDNVTLGDVNLDGKVNAIDFAFMRRTLLGIDRAFTDGAATAADVNKDGKFNAIDFAKVRQFLLGIIKSF